MKGIVGMASTIVLLHVIGWSLILAAHGESSGRGAFGLGLGVAAYTLGLRHAFDADHIAAIDNTTRKLVGDGAKPTSVGFWFSLGHSTVVLALTLALAAGARSVASAIEDRNSALHQITGFVGAAASGLFLYAIATINLALLVAGIRRMRADRSDEERTEADDGAAPAGPLTRAFAPVMRSIRSPGQMYPLGLLFGFGFDTATEIGLLVIAATSAAGGVPWYGLLGLPIVFAAGMSLLDTTDGLLMRHAYGWAFMKPGRRMRYNLSITALSVGVALVVGTIEIVTVLAGPGGGGALAWLTSIDLSAVGIGVVAALAAVWLAALSVSRVARMRRKLAP